MRPHDYWLLNHLVPGVPYAHRREGNGGIEKPPGHPGASQQVNQVTGLKSYAELPAGASE